MSSAITRRSGVVSPGPPFAVDGGVTAVLVADRFHRRDDASWIDLATGAVVEVRVETGPPDAMARAETACHREWHGPPTRLIDWGRAGDCGWFETRGDRAVDAVAADRDAATLLSAADGLTSPGVHCLIARDLAPSSDLAVVLARRYRLQGLLPLRPCALRLSPPAEWALRRHVALLLCDDDDVAAALAWMHALSRLSTRTHLVVDLREPRTSSRPRLARDRTDDAWCSEALPASAGRVQRALRAARRRRAAEAERWARAALESARRHRNTAGLAEASRALVDLLLARDEYAGALRSALDVTERLQGSAHWPEGAAALADVLVPCGELARADALLTTARSHGALTGAPVSKPVLRALAWLRFWQGRFEEFATLAHDLAGSAPELAGLAGWVARDCTRLRRAASELAKHARHDPVTAMWSHTFTALASAYVDDDDERRADTAKGMLSATTRVSHAHAARLARALAADLLIAAGRPDDAQRALGSVEVWSRASVVEQWLSRWLRAAGDARERADLAIGLERTGALGLRRWGSGREVMQLAHEVPAVLQLVQDADDEAVALARGCQWLRRTADACGVAVLAAEDLALVASDGWSAADVVAAGWTPGTMEDRCASFHGDTVLVSVAMKHAGTPIGWLVVRGAAERGSTFRDLGRVLAAVCAPSLQGRLDALAAARRGPALTPEILGVSPAIMSLRESVARAAVTPFSVLIEGESGTGKELVARAIHRLSPRRDRRLSSLNCAALSDDLIEAELFGHVRGAFTGAVNPRVGLFEEANGGSLFLDEVGELSPRAQAKLLRVLQERELRRVGENVPRAVDVRVIAATNQPLADACARGAFRADLLFRLAVVRIRTTPLRERPEDIPVLARALWHALTLEAGRRVVLGPDALAALCRHAWPGNVREFQNVLAGLLVVAPERGRVSVRHVQQVLSSEAEVPGSAPLHLLRSQFERRAIRVALARHGGRRAAAARELGLTRQGLVKAIRRLKLGGADGEAEGVA
ncbi:MAG: sigma 54-interacting transcriptional regulator [Acidobacteria bacterium]|nr:sigma 54-interacting transcriptional regulator [Acidobacteriota bacterium]